MSVNLSTEDFRVKFEENEISTRLIPRLSSDTESLIEDLSNVLYKDCIYYPPKDQYFNVILRLFAKNYYETTSPIAKFKIPDFIDGYSRHLYLIFNNKYDSLIFFSSGQNQKFFSDGAFDRVVKKGVHIFDIKEMQKDVFYIKMADISYNLSSDNVLGPDMALQILNDSENEIDLDEFTQITSTWRPISTRQQ